MSKDLKYKASFFFSDDLSILFAQTSYQRDVKFFIVEMNRGCLLARFNCLFQRRALTSSCWYLSRGPSFHVSSWLFPGWKLLSSPRTDRRKAWPPRVTSPRGHSIWFAWGNLWDTVCTRGAGLDQRCEHWQCGTEGTSCWWSSDRTDKAKIELESSHKTPEAVLQGSIKCQSGTIR